MFIKSEAVLRVVEDIGGRVLGSYTHTHTHTHVSEVVLRVVEDM